MNNLRFINTILNISISLVWLINGFFCKVLNFVPRHQEIVARILGHEHSLLLTKAIGVSEVFMAIWVITKIQPRYCALAQILLVAAMNIIEFIMVPDLLLFGRINICIAAIFIGVIYFTNILSGNV